MGVGIVGRKGMGTDGRARGEMRVDVKKNETER